MLSAIIMSAILSATPTIESSVPSLSASESQSPAQAVTPAPRPSVIPIVSVRPNPMPEPVTSEVLFLSSPDGEDDILFFRGFLTPPSWLHAHVNRLSPYVIGMRGYELIAAEIPTGGQGGAPAQVQAQGQTQVQTQGQVQTQTPSSTGAPQSGAPVAAPAVRGAPPTTDADCARFEPKMEKSAYMGLFTAPVNDTMREQLELPRGIGLIVEVLDPAGPAKASGLQQHDILTKFDDQLLINSQQLAVLVRSRKPGSSVDLTVLRKSKEIKLTVKLGEKMLPLLDAQAFFNHEFPGDVFPPASNGPNWTNPAGPDRPVTTTIGRNPMRLIGTRRLNVVIDQPDRRLIFSPKDGHEYLRVVDTAGSVIFEGPIETRADREKLPSEYKKWLATYDKIAHPNGYESATSQPASTQPAPK